MDLMTSTCSFARSLVRHVSVLSQIVFFGSVSSFFVVQGCASETQERPISSGSVASKAPRTDASRVADLPLPESAFQDENAAAPSRVVKQEDTSRFATRTIGNGGGGGGGGEQQRHFRGAPVDLDLRSADIHDVFRLLADVGRVNIVVAGEVSGQVTMRLRHVPWDQAMDVIARARGLAYEREGNVILVRAAGAGTSTK
jgi:hypothetical protein